MRLLTHLLATDVRRFGALIALYVLVAAAGAALDVAAPSLSLRPDSRQWLFFSTRLLLLADGLLAFSLVAVVVQAHPLVGSDAFWMTRPIRWDALLLSKLLLLTAVLVGVPLGLELVQLRVYDVPFAPLSRAAAQMAFIRAVGLVIVMAIAAVTSNVARFALVGGGALLVAAVAAAAANLVRVGGGQAYGIRLYPPGELGVAAGDRDGTWAIVALGLLGVAALALVLMQYRRRSMARAVATGVVGAALAVVIGMTWPWTLLAAPSGIEIDATRSIQLSGNPESLSFDPLVYAGEHTRWQLGRAELHVTGVPPGWLAAATLLRASIDYEGGRLASPGHSLSTLLPFADRSTDEGPITVTTREVLGVPTLGIGPGSGTSGLAFRERASVGRALAFILDTVRPTSSGGLIGTYRGEFAIALTQMESVATLPLQPGARFHDANVSVAIDDLIREESRLRIRGRTSWVRTIFDRTPRPSYKFFIRNRTRAEASNLDSRRLPAVTGGAFGPRSSGFEVFVEELIFRWHDAGLAQLDATYLADSELVMVRSTYRGSVFRVLEMRGVKVLPVTDHR